MDESRLFEDVHTVVEMSKAMTMADPSAAMPEVSAIEQGRREHPDGTTEDYQRVVFR